MDVILKVTTGSKVGTKIAVKKNPFLIGRSPECHLCAGSTSISRRHCQINRDGNRVTIQDLGSRNGTQVNGVKIDSECELQSGDTLTIGTLEFLITITSGIQNEKKPPLKSVAEAVERSVEKSSGSDIKDDDISRWLLDEAEKESSQSPATDTQTIRLDDTKTSELQAAIKEMREESGDKLIAPEDTDEENHHDEETKKKKPGKLPPNSKKPATKDSCEAATEALRSWSRRR